MINRAAERLITMKKRDFLPHPYHQDSYAEALKLREAKRLTGSEIARRLGLKRETVCSWLRAKRINSAAVHVQAPHVIVYRKAIKLWREEKLSAYAIAKKLGLPDSLVRTWIKKERYHEEHSKAIR